MRRAYSASRRWHRASSIWGRSSAGCRWRFGSIRISVPGRWSDSRSARSAAAPCSCSCNCRRCAHSAIASDRISIGATRYQRDLSAHGAVGHCRKHDAIQRTRQFDVCLDTRRRRDFRAVDRFPAHAAATRPIRRRARHGHAAPALAPRGREPYRRVSVGTRARDAPWILADGSRHRGAHGARRADHLGAVSTRQVRRRRDHRGRRCTEILCARPLRLRGAQGPRQRVLRTR